MINKYN